MKEETHWVIKRNRVCKIRSDDKSNKFCVGNVWKPLFQTKVFMARLQLPFISTFHRSSPSRGSHLSTPPQARPLSLPWPFVFFLGGRDPFQCSLSGQEAAPTSLDVAAGCSARRQNHRAQERFHPKGYEISCVAPGRDRHLIFLDIWTGKNPLGGQQSPGRLWP